MMVQKNGQSGQADSAPDPIDEGGLRAPPGLKGWRKAWWWFDFIVLVKLARLRFVAVLVVIGVVITQWDLLVAYYDRWTHRASAADMRGGEFEWFCPMHPSVVRDNGSEKCPVCFMPLSKRKKGERRDEALPAGIVNRVQLSPYRIVLAGARTWPLEYQSVAKEIEAVGFVEFNERGQRTVSARISGRIEKLFVNETGQMVAAGRELASIYSPDLVVTVQNLLDAKRTGSAKNEESAKRRLELLGIDDQQIDEILNAGQQRTQLIIRSPISGHIIKKYVREGQYVSEGDPLYDVADLSVVWIQAQVYEDDMEFLPFKQQEPRDVEESGMEVSAKTRAFPNEAFNGRLAFVYPHVDQNTRTLTIRCEVENPGHKLRPGSTATVTLRVLPQNMPSLAAAVGDDAERAQMLAEGKVLAVPEAAVIDTGAQSIVYRETAPGQFEGVRVTLGPRMTGPAGAALYPVLEGLERGDRIVTAGSFLVDAETRLNPAAGSIYFGGSGSKSAAGASRVLPSTPEDADAQLTAALSKLSDDDRKLVEAQRYCPVLLQNRLGSMGKPVKLLLDGQAVFVCCEACKEKATANAAQTLATVAQLLKDPHGAAPNKKEAEIEAELAKLSPEDQRAARQQRFCAVLETSRLGSMGKPEKLTLNGQEVFVCCEGCVDEAKAQPESALAKAAKLRAQTKKGTK